MGTAETNPIFLGSHDSRGLRNALLTSHLCNSPTNAQIIRLRTALSSGTKAFTQLLYAVVVYSCCEFSFNKLKVYPLTFLHNQKHVKLILEEYLVWIFFPLYINKLTEE